MPDSRTEHIERITLAGVEYEQRTIVELTAAAPPPPNPQTTIISFAADRHTIVSGESVTLTWSVEGADRTYLNGADMTGQTSVTLQPTTTTTYTLRVEDDAGQWPIDSATVTITVEEPPPPPPSDGPSGVQISVLQSSLAVNPGETVRLNYAFTNCSAAWLTIEGQRFDLDPTQGTVDVGPFSFSSSFPLTALDMQGRPAIEPLSVVVRGVAPTPSTTRQVTSGGWPADTTEADAVLVPEGQSVSLAGRRAVAGAVVVAGELALTDAVLYAAWVHVMPTGKLLLDGSQKKSLVVLRNHPQSQLLVEGRMVTHGRARTHSLRLAVPAKKGDEVIHLEDAPVGWEIGHKIALPRGSKVSQSSQPAMQEDEIAVVRYVDGATVHLLHPLKYDRSQNLVDVLHLITSTGVIAADPTDMETRAYVKFIGQDNSVHNCVFHGVGRRRVDGKGFKTPQSPVHLDHLDDTSEFVDCVSLDPHPLVNRSPVCWGFDVDHCQGAKLINCISYNWYGWGFRIEGGIPIVENCRAHRIDGKGDRGDVQPLQTEGAGLGSTTFSATVRGFRGSDCRKYAWNVFAPVGDPWRGPPGIWEDMHATSCELGGAWWSVGASGGPLPNQPEMILRNLHCQGIGQQALFPYSASGITIDGLFFRNVKVGYWGTDYLAYRCKVKRVRMEDPSFVGSAIVLPLHVNVEGFPLEPFTVEDCDLQNTSISIIEPFVAGGTGTPTTRWYEIRNVRGAKALFFSRLDPKSKAPNSTWWLPEKIYVENVNGDGKRYRLWRPEQVAPLPDGQIFGGELAPEGVTPRPWSGNMLVEELT